MFICCLSSPSSLSFLTWFPWRRGSCSSSSAGAAVPSWRSAFAILTGCCGAAVTRLGMGSPWPEPMKLPWRQLLAREKGGWHAFPALCGGTVAQLGCCSRVVTAASPSASITAPPCVEGSKPVISVDAICYTIAAVSERFPVPGTAPSIELESSWRLTPPQPHGTVPIL